MNNRERERIAQEADRLDLPETAAAWRRSKSLESQRGACPAEHGGKMQDCAAYPACACDYPSD